MARSLIALASVFLAFAGLPAAADADPPDVTPPVVSIAGFPQANSTFGTFVFSADEDDVTFECQLDDAEDWTVCLSPTQVIGLSEGAHVVRIRGTDSAGNTSDPPESHAWTVDLTPPDAPAVLSPAQGTATNDPQPSISGTAEAEAEVEVFNINSLLGTAPVDSAGEWSFSPPAPLTDNNYVIRVRTRDPAGNLGPSSVSLSLRVDTVAPQAPTILSPAAAAKTNGADLVVSGVAEPLSQVTVFADGTSLGVAVADTFGSWVLVPGSAPPDGAAALTAQATDAAGNTGNLSVGVTISLESLPPPAPLIASPADGSVFTTSALEISGTAEAESSVRIYRGATKIALVVANSAGEWSASLDEPDGHHTYTATATDAHGNTGAPSTSVSLVVDTTPPTVQFTSGPPKQTQLRTATLEFTADEVVATFECELDGLGWLPCSNPYVSPELGLGEHSFRVRATDAAGNLGDASFSFEWTIVTEPVNSPPSKVVDSTPTSPATRLAPTKSCLFRGRKLGRAAAMTDLVVERSKRRSPQWRRVLTVKFKSSLTAIARVAITRGSAVIASRSVRVRRGGNRVNLIVKSFGARTVSVSIHSVSLSGGRGVAISAARVVDRGAALRLIGGGIANEQTCRRLRGVRAAKLRVLHLRHDAKRGRVVATVISDQLVVLASRLEAGGRAESGRVRVLRPGRRHRMTMKATSVLTHGRARAILHLTAFNSEFRQTRTARRMIAATKDE